MQQSEPEAAHALALVVHLLVVLTLSARAVLLVGTRGVSIRLHH